MRSSQRPRRRCDVVSLSVQLLSKPLDGRPTGACTSPSRSAQTRNPSTHLTSQESPILALAALDGQASDWLTTFGPIAFYLIVWGLVFSGTGLFVGVFIPFITGDSLLFAAGLIAARADGVDIWVLAAGVGVAAFLGDQVGFVLGRHYGRPYLDRRKGGWIASAVAKSEKFYDDLGWWAVVVARSSRGGASSCPRSPASPG